ncbi:MAG: hypothetical protein E7621_00915 [Ruminococcaceae bacterium]|nr:hypothetical protein [Oscillospiraceae bacterium]
MANNFNTEKRKRLKTDPEKTKKELRKRKKKLVVIAFSVCILLGILAFIAYVVIPAFDSGINIERSEIITGNFYSEDEITPEIIDIYEKEYKYKGYIAYTFDGQTSYVNSQSAYSSGGKTAEFFVKYFDAVAEGDKNAYSLLFSPGFDFSKDPYASGKIDFPPQRIYDVSVELSEEIYDKNSGITKGTFFVDYRIYCNEGNFRIDIDKDHAFSPLVFETETFGDEIKIVDIYHRYGK